MEEFIATQEKFHTLQSAVAKELENRCQAMRDPWYSYTSIINIYYGTTILLAFLFSLFLLVPLALQVFVKMFGNNLLLSYKEPISLSIFAVIIILPAILPGYLFVKYPKHKSLIRLFASFILIPLVTTLIYITLNYLLEKRLWPDSMPNVFFLIPFLFLLVSIPTTVAVAVIRLLRPNFLVLLASNRINIDPHEKSLSYESIAKEVIKNTYIYSQHWSTSTVQKVRTYSQNRSAQLSTQIQTVSPALGAISLVSLVALIFTSEQTQSIVKFFNNVLKTVTERSSESNLNILIIAGIVLFAIGSCTYFVNSYWSLCVLEIIDTLCLIRIEECEREKKDIEERLSSHQSLLYSQTYTGTLLNYLRQFSFKSSHHKGKY